MALTSQLPIYIDTYNLLKRLLTLVARMPRAYRFNVGERMVNTALDMMALIGETNATRDKVVLIEQLLRKYEMLRMLLRLVYESQGLSSRQYAPFVELLDKIGRQATGWKNHYLR